MSWSKRRGKRRDEQRRDTSGTRSLAAPPPDPQCGFCEPSYGRGIGSPLLYTSSHHPFENSLHWRNEERQRRLCCWSKVEGRSALVQQRTKLKISSDRTYRTPSLSDSDFASLKQFSPIHRRSSAIGSSSKGGSNSSPSGRAAISRRQA